MSFADELRTASNVNTSELRRERDFEDFVKIFYDYVKDDCEYYASKGEDSCKIRYDTFIKDCEKNHQWEKWYIMLFTYAKLDCMSIMYQQMIVTQIGMVILIII